MHARALVLLVLPLLAACDDSGRESSLIGTWRLVTVCPAAAPCSDPEELRFLEFTSPDRAVRTSDGEVTFDGRFQLMPSEAPDGRDLVVYWNTEHDAWVHWLQIDELSSETLRVEPSAAPGWRYEYVRAELAGLPTF